MQYAFANKLGIVSLGVIAKFRRARLASAATGVVTLMLIGIVTAFSTVTNSVNYPGELSQVVEQIEIPALQLVTSSADTIAREVRIQRGDTASSLFSKLNIQDNAADYLRSEQEAEALFRQLAPGKTLTARVGTDGELASLIFPLNGGKDMALHIIKNPSGFSAQTRNLQLESRITLQSAVIRHSLFGASDEAGIPEAIAIQLTDIFGGDIDFHRDIRKGDRFSVIYETTTHLGKPVRTERIIAAEFVNDGKPFRAIWYQGANGTEGYYTPNGRSLKKAFLRSPLEFSRITSSFSSARYHPVLREIRAHNGIDYGAPTGTRVKATSSGIVEYAGTQGGYGKVIMLRHPGDKVTVYGHLSGFAANLRKGMRVAQGDVIGFVGATGMATGPHLHYEFRVAGIHHNPLTVTLPTAPPLPPPELSNFQARAEEWLSQIEAIEGTQLVILD